MASGLVLKRGVRVTTMPAKAPKGNRWTKPDCSILGIILPDADGKRHTVFQDMGTSPNKVLMILFNSQTLKNCAWL
jgi:hypothetical protein